jgi:hypothetical protein
VVSVRRSSVSRYGGNWSGSSAFGVLGAFQDYRPSAFGHYETIAARVERAARLLGFFVSG